MNEVQAKGVSHCPANRDARASSPQAQVWEQPDGTLIVRLICQRRMQLVPCHLPRNHKTFNLMPIGWSPMEDGDEMWLVMRNHRILDAEYLRHWFNRYKRKPKPLASPPQLKETA